MKYLICNGGVGRVRELNFVNITSWRYVNDVPQVLINKELYLQTFMLLCLEALSMITWHFNVLHREMQAARNVVLAKANIMRM